MLYFILKIGVQHQVNRTTQKRKKFKNFTDGLIKHLSLSFSSYMHEPHLHTNYCSLPLSSHQSHWPGGHRGNRGGCRGDRHVEERIEVGGGSGLLDRKSPERATLAWRRRFVQGATAAGSAQSGSCPEERAPPRRPPCFRRRRVLRSIWNSPRVSICFVHEILTR